jgi:hypothetical protein
MIFKSIKFLLCTGKKEKEELLLRLLGLSWRRERQAFDVEGLPWGYIYTHTLG